MRATGSGFKETVCNSSGDSKLKWEVRPDLVLWSESQQITFSELTVPWEDAAAVTHEGKMLRLKLAAELGQQGYKTGKEQLSFSFADRSRSAVFGKLGIHGLNLKQTLKTTGVF